MFKHLLAAALLLAPTGAVAADPPHTVAPGSLSYGTTATFAPFEFERDGQTVGFDIDLMAELARRTGLKAEVLGMDFAGIVPAVAAGRIDAAMSGMYITPARQEVLDFIPYLLIGNQLMTTAANPGHLTGKDGLCGHPVAVPVNTQFQKTLEALSAACTAAGKPAVDILLVPGSAVLALTVAQGRAEAGLTSNSVVAALDTQSPGTFATLGDPFDTDTRLGIGIGKNNAALRDALAAALQAMHADGAYDALIHKWGLPAASSIF